jgi:5-methylcytosine-specific restriction endonuclease McrA
LYCDLILEQWLHLLEQSEGKCHYCHVLDHMIPIIRGGGTTLTNVVAACRKCNTDKRGRTFEEWETNASDSTQNCGRDWGEPG